MFAVVKTGGKQYKVASGDVLQVEKLEGEVGSTVALDEVLAIGGDEVKVGAPLVAGAVVNAEIVKQGKADKVIVFKKKRRHNYRRKQGHRQLQTTIKIADIALDGAKKAAPKKTAAKKDEAKPAEKKADAKKAAPKKTAAKKPAEKKEAGEKKAAPKKTAAKKTTAKKAAPKKTAAKKADKE